VGDGNPLIEANVIMSNSGRYGAGVVLNYTGVRMRNNAIYNNRGGQDYGGGGIWAYQGASAPKVIVNNTIAFNVSSNIGGGLRAWQVDSIVCVNNIFWRNDAVNGAQIQEDGGVGVAYCDVMGGRAGTGNIDADPRFGSENFYLTSVSPCVDAGDPAINDPDSSGAAKWPAMGALRSDIGAYGGPGSGVLATTFYGIAEQSPARPGVFGLSVQPQPCRSSALVSFVAPARGDASLTLFDATGRRAGSEGGERREERGSPLGRQQVRLDVSGLAAGTYICRLESGGRVETVPVVVAR
jgi:hypothetical protein